MQPASQPAIQEPVSSQTEYAGSHQQAASQRRDASQAIRSALSAASCTDWCSANWLALNSLYMPFGLLWYFTERDTPYLVLQLMANIYS